MTMDAKIKDIVTKVSTLPSDEAVVFKLKTFHNLSVSTIANRLSIDNATVWQLLHQARVTLMQ